MVGQTALLVWRTAVFACTSGNTFEGTFADTSEGYTLRNTFAESTWIAKGIPLIAK